MIRRPTAWSFFSLPICPPPTAIGEKARRWKRLMDEDGATMKQLAVLLALVSVFPIAAAADENAVKQEDDSRKRDLALAPPNIIISPWSRHIPPTKRQGVPGIERTLQGRLWAVYGRDVESTRNYQVLKCSDDDGRSWSDVKLMILPRKGVRAMSACIWIDPQQRMWVFWGQSYGQQDGRYGVWAIVTDNPDSADPQWSSPRRIGDGIMLNKPTVLKKGDWLFTSSVWKAENSIRVYDYNRMPDGAILMAAFREEDVRAGTAVTDEVRMRVEISRLAEKPSLEPEGARHSDER
jgi:hypothetical protein